MSKADASHDLGDVSRASSAGSTASAMRYTPTLQDLRVKRLHLRRSWFTPRKCLAAFAASLVAAATVVRLTWTLSHAYSQLHSASDTDGELIILPEDSVRQSGAFCLDGSRPGFYFRRGKGHSKRWLIALPGTGWCWTAEECGRWRSATWLGTTRDIETTHPFSAILSADCETNRVFCEWNVALVAPCDGASFLGNRTATLHFDGSAMYMRGSAVLTAVLDHLATAMGLSLAEHAVLYGQSSSSLAAMLHVDYVRSLLSSRRGSAVAIADGGVTLGDAIGYRRIADVVRLHGVADARSVRRCAGSPDDAAGVERCLFVDGVAARTRSRVVLLASLFDPWTHPLLPPVAPPPSARREPPPPATAAVLQRLYAEELYARRLIEFVRTPPPPETDRCTVVTTCHVPLLPQPSPHVAAALAATAGPTVLSTHLPPIVARGGGGGYDGGALLDSVARWLRPTDADRCAMAVYAIDDEALAAGLSSCLPTATAEA